MQEGPEYPIGTRCASGSNNPTVCGNDKAHAG